ncbi:hypothetical protein D3C83_30370 [compost metagenome]
MLAWTFCLLSLASLTIFFASSWSTPWRRAITCFTLLPLTFSMVPGSRQRTSTPRLASLPVSTSRNWPSLKSSSAKAVSVFSFSLISVRASEPLKSNRLAISLLL